MISRRKFLKVGGIGGLCVAVLPACKESSTATSRSSTTSKPATVAGANASEPSPSTAISAWIHIAEDDTITYYVPEAEMGQGIHTAVALVLGAELGAAWKYATATTAPLNAEFGLRQSTGGSTSIRTGYDSFRLAGATARHLLIAAGAEAMQAPVSECEAKDSKVHWAKGNKSLRFGELAMAAAKLPVPEKPALRDSLEFPTGTKRLDSFDKVTGRAKYGIDVAVDNMAYAMIAHAPSVGGKPKSFDDTAARKVAGVQEVVQISSGIVVIADHTWAAKKGRDALQTTWEEPNKQLSSEQITKKLKAALGKGVTVHKFGNAPAALKTQKHVIEAQYSVPYLAHAPMEPLSCVARVQNDQCDIWTSTQNPTGAAGAAAEITGLPFEKIHVHSQFLGGGFGRRSSSDYVREAVETAKKSGKTVKLQWEREDDIRGYQYRPAALNSLRAAVDPKSGTLLAWEHRIASPSILKQFRPLWKGIDGTSVDGVIKYGTKHMLVTYGDVDLPIPTWFWRSVGHSQNAFVTDAFMNEAAKAANRDPLEFRLATRISRLNGDGELVDSPRLKRVMAAVATASRWGQARPSGTALGISVGESFGSFVAQVAEVSLEKGKPKVQKVYCAIDCGQRINETTIRAQLEGSIAYGLSATLHGNIEFRDGRVVQGNFDTYPVVRMSEMPLVETIIVDSDEAHGGVGEPATPPVAGAVAGALFALTGKPVRRLPILT